MVGRFEMFGAIASGGFASIHLGRTVGAGGFSKMVAIKRLHRQFVEDREITKMFLDEARLVARIQHPNVVPTIDFIAEGGELFMVMEYIEGATLAHLLQELDSRGHRIPLDVTLRIMSGALHGLHAAHEARDERGAPMCVIHRDVSPDNILVGVDGYPRILDFGVAKALGSYHATRDGLVKGKMAYLTPEQVMGKPLTRRTDVFSAAVVLWQCLAGRQLFSGEHLMELAVKVMQEPLVPPSAYNPGIPPKCDLVVMRGLERDPEQRWQTAELMAEAVEDAGKLATPARVGKWVRATAAERLANRASRVAAVELTPTGTEISADELSDSLEQPSRSARSGAHAVPRPAPPEAAGEPPQPHRRGMAGDDDETTTLFSMGERDFKAVTTQVMSMPRATTRATYVRPAAGSPAEPPSEGVPSEPGDVPTRVRIAPAVAAPPPAAMALHPAPAVAAVAPAGPAAPGSYPGMRPPPSRPDPATVPMPAVPSAPVTLPQATVPMPAVPSAPGSQPAVSVEAAAAAPSGSSEHGFASGMVDPQALVVAEPPRARRRAETSLSIELLEGARTKSRYVPWLVGAGALAVVIGGIGAVALSGQSSPSTSAASASTASPEATGAPAATAAAATSVVAVEPPAPEPTAAATAEPPPSAVAEAPAAPPEPATAAPPEPAPTQGKRTAGTKPAGASGASGKAGATKGKGKSEDDLFSRK